MRTPPSSSACGLKPSSLRCFNETTLLTTISSASSSRPLMISSRCSRRPPPASSGLGDVPLICARELAVTGAMARCVRVLMHFYTERPREELHHVYLESARGLRDDLPE